MAHLPPHLDLRRVRARANMTQRQLAGRLGIAPNTVARWERGETPIPTWVGRFLGAVEDAWAQIAILEGDRDNWERAKRRAQTEAEILRWLLDRVSDDPTWPWTWRQRRNRLRTTWRLKQQQWERQRASWRARRPEPDPAADHADAVTATLFKRLARKYHPDRNPAGAEIMKDLNELRQSLKRRGAGEAPTGG